MEKINFQKNILENFEKLSPKIKSVIFGITLSFSSFLPKEIMAQIYPQIIPDSSAMEVKNPLDTLNPSVFQAVRESVLEQRKWILEYLNSDKYLERLAKEYFYFKKMSGTTEKDFLNIDDFTQVKKNKEGDTVHIYHFPSKSTQILETGFSKIDWEKVGVGDFLKEPDLSTFGKEDWFIVEFMRSARIENVQNGRWMIVDDLPYGDLGVYNPSSSEGFFYLYFNDGVSQIKKETEIPLAGLSVFKNTFQDEKEQLIGTHEIGGHQSLDGSKLMIMFTSFIQKFLVKTGSGEYLSNPKEIYARIFVFRAKLAELGLYDAKTEDFTKKTLEKIKKNKEKYNQLLENHSIEQLFDILEEDDLIWLMNNVADMGDYYFISPEEMARNIEKQIQTG